jgi:membrane protein implicated in regulation of membrane protease activity
MLALGIVLIVLAVLFGLGVSVSSGDSTTMSVFGVDFGLSVPTLFFLGAAAGIAVTLGLWLTKKGLGRGYRRHKEVRQLRQKVAAVDSPTGEGHGSHEASDPHGSPATRETVGDGVDTVGTPTSRHAADPASGDPSGDSVGDDRDSRTVDLSAGDRLAADRHIVADGTDSKQPH